MNKKSIVFTFITVTLLLIILISFLININNRIESKIQTTNIKVETLNSFVKNLNSTYLPDALRSSSNQVILSLIDYDSNLSVNHNVDNYFKDVILDGYLINLKQENMFQNNLNYTLEYTLNEINKSALQQGVIFQYSKQDINDAVNSMIINQEDPWHVKVNMVFSYAVKDVRNEFNWTIKNAKISSLLSVENYRDPLYLLNPELGNIGLKIKKSPYQDFKSIELFEDHVSNEYFYPNSNAPSFLKRLQNDLTSDSNGIESLLDPIYYVNGDGFSNADYQYLNNVPGFCVEDMNSNFKLDEPHIDYYNRKNCLDIS